MDFREEIDKALKLVPQTLKDRVQLKVLVGRILIKKAQELAKYSASEQKELVERIKDLCKKANVKFDK